MEKFDSITHFIKTGGFEYRIFDMGRKVLPLSNKWFESIESQQEIYPYPFQKKAFLALLLWQKRETRQMAKNESNENNEKKTQIESEVTIWFLQFPIDELGFLQQASRDAFLIELLEQTGKNIHAKQKGNKVLDELNESPFAFKPQDDRLAMFHALATRELGQEPSHYYQATREYLKGTLGYEQWQFLGLQGIADVVARLDKKNINENSIDEKSNEALLIDALDKMPKEPLENFSLMLENVSFGKSLATSLAKLLRKELNSEAPDIKLASALIRGLSEVEPNDDYGRLLNEVLVSEYLSQEIEILVAISAKAWGELYDEKLLIVFIEVLSKQNQMAFNAVLVDLMMLPTMKQKVLAVMRRSERSALLIEKLSGFMQVMQS